MSKLPLESVSGYYWVYLDFGKVISDGLVWDGRDGNPKGAHGGMWGCVFLVLGTPSCTGTDAGEYGFL